MRRIANLIKITNIIVGIIILSFFVYLGIRSFNKISEKLTPKTETKKATVKAEGNYLEDFKKAIEEYLK